MDQQSSFRSNMFQPTESVAHVLSTVQRDSRFSAHSASRSVISLNSHDQTRMERINLLKTKTSFLDLQRNHGLHFFF